MDTVDAGGHRIAYDRKGEGPPLVLLHGYVGDRRMWRTQIDGLSDEFTVVAWDAPGYGGSSDPPKAFRLSDFAECLAAFVDALGLGRPHVAGIPSSRGRWFWRRRTPGGPAPYPPRSSSSASSRRCDWLTYPPTGWWAN
jgi:hypothetical protein